MHTIHMVIRLGYLFESMWQSVKSPFCVLSVCFVCFPPLWQSEVTLLRNEVARLKQLLLAHKDCPVTAMQKKSAYHSELCSIILSPRPHCKCIQNEPC